jgi:hypothetical protein
MIRDGPPQRVAGKSRLVSFCFAAQVPELSEDVLGQQLALVYQRVDVLTDHRIRALDVLADRGHEPSPPRSIRRSVGCLLFQLAPVGHESSRSWRRRTGPNDSVRVTRLVLKLCRSFHRDDGQLNLPDTCSLAAMPSCLVADTSFLRRRINIRRSASNRWQEATIGDALTPMSLQPTHSC